MEKTVTTNQLRSFGYTVGGVFAVIGFWPTLFHSKDPRIGAIILAGVLQSLALMAPRSLSGAYRGWMIVGHCLGWFNTRLLLGVTFYAVFTPLGLILRLLGRDSMNFRFDPSAPTYRVLRRARLPSHLRQQF